MKYKEQILKLREEGKTYHEIKSITGAALSTISYYCGKGQKEKVKQRRIKHYNKSPIYQKIDNFLRNRKNIVDNKNKTIKTIKLLDFKIKSFHKNRKTGEYYKMSFTIKDVIDKFGENPKCYLTGKQIDIYQPRTYHFDHITPVSKGGDNSIENLGICTKEANMAKSDSTLEEFIELCKTVLIKNNYEIIKIERDNRNP